MHVFYGKLRKIKQKQNSASGKKKVYKMVPTFLARWSIELKSDIEAASKKQNKNKQKARGVKQHNTQL